MGKEGGGWGVEPSIFFFFFFFFSFAQVHVVNNLRNMNHRDKEVIKHMAFHNACPSDTLMIAVSLMLPLLQRLRVWLGLMRRRIVYLLIYAEKEQVCLGWEGLRLDRASSNCVEKPRIWKVSVLSLRKGV